MGRRNVRVQDERRWVFNRLAPFYRFRPPYPTEVVDCLATLAGAGGNVADLGAGTGSLSLPLAERGLRVSAVEPASAMLQELRAAASTCDQAIACVHAAAESTGLPSHFFSLVLVADALHWLDPERAGAEIRRLLAPRGSVAVVEVRLTPTPFVLALEQRLRTANPKAAPIAGARLEQILALAVPRARQRTTLRFAVTDDLDPEQLRGTLCSLSYVAPALGPAATHELLADVERIAARHGGAQWPREITVTHATR